MPQRVQLHAGEEAVSVLAEGCVHEPSLCAEVGRPPAPGGAGRFGALEAVSEGAHEPSFEAFHATTADEIEAAVAQVRPCARLCRIPPPTAGVCVLEMSTSKQAVPHLD